MKARGTATDGGAGGAGVSRELLAVLLPREPLDERKWHYLDLGARGVGR